jgi:hypothetical protein
MGAFRKFHNIPDNKSVVLMIDGEELLPEMTMEGAEIEDFNMIEVYVR